MASKRDKTAQIGFWDDEVSKPSHDEITIWAYQNSAEIVKQYVTEFLPKEVKRILSSEWTREHCRAYLRGMNVDLVDLPLKPNVLVKSRVIEHVIQQYPDNSRSLPRILGYGDLLIVWNDECLDWDDKDKKWLIHNEVHHLLVEVKSILPTLGELMRQVNLYRQVYRNVAVVAPDASYSSILKEQGILFVPYVKLK